MALPPLSIIARPRRDFLRNVTGAWAALDVAMDAATSLPFIALGYSARSNKSFLRDCGFIDDSVDARIDLGVLPPA